jgi:two-component system sensor histidine kinase KdpD
MKTKKLGNLSHYLFSTLAVALATVIGTIIHRYVEPTNIVMLYLAVVVVSAFFWGRGPAIFASFVSVLAFDYFLVNPRLSFSVADTQYLITFAGLFTVGLIISSLTASVQSQIKELQEKDKINTTLYSLSRSLSEAKGKQGVLEAIYTHLQNTFRADIEIALDDSVSLTYQSSNIDFSERINEISVSENTTVIKLPASSGFIGSIRVMRTELSFKELDLLKSCALLAGMAIERVYLDEQASKAKTLQEVEKLQTALLDTVSHDLRTPLVSISGTLETLQASEQGNAGLNLTRDMRLNMIDNARQEAQYLNRLVGDLLDLSRLESNAIHLSCDYYDINEILGAGFVKVRQRQGNHKFITQIEENLPMLWLDIVLIERVLTNLLDNSIKFSPDGSPITIKAGKEKDEIILRIINLGPKIASVDLEHIFDKFNLVRVSKSVAGTGLGLSICKRIIEIHKGRIWAENNRGEGCQFIIALPINNGPEESAK